MPLFRETATDVRPFVPGCGPRARPPLIGCVNTALCGVTIIGMRSFVP